MPTPSSDKIPVSQRALDLGGDGNTVNLFRYAPYVPYPSRIVWARIAAEIVNPAHPKYFASPNACSFPNCASSLGLGGGVFVGNSTYALSNDAPYSHSSNPMVCFHKKTGRFDSGSNPNYNSASGTTALPTDATTSHCRKIFPHPSQEPHRHLSPVSPPLPAVRQTRLAEAEKR
jgi:hypothetical protein